MSLQHSFFGKGLAPWCIALALAGGSVFAQEGIIPLGPEVELALDCTYDPLAFETEDQAIGLWWRRYGGIFGRTGPSLDQLGPIEQLNQDMLNNEVVVAPLSGGFAAAWTRLPVAQPPEVVLQSFGADLSPSFPAVVAGAASASPAPALLADPDGQLVLAYYGPTGSVQLQRYSSAGAPLSAAFDADPTVFLGEHGRIRLAAGEDGFLVVWSGFRGGENPYLWARAFGWDGTPAAAAESFISADIADFDVAWAEGSYLVVVPAGSQVRGIRLDENGNYLDKAFGLAADDTHHARLAAGDGALWLAFVGNDALLGSRIELPSLAVDPVPQILVPRPENGQRFIARSSAFPSAEGFLGAWQMAPVNVILHPCMDTDTVYAQAFGPPRGVVDVPTAAPPGLLVLALLTAAGALVLLRRT